MENKILKLAVGVGYVAMVLTNFLANALPIGGVTTGEASDAYSNLFTPAGWTFSIWGLIYILLLGYVLHQFGLLQREKNEKREEKFLKISPYFLTSSILNISWIFAWHYGVLWLSVLIMLGLLFSLIKIAGIINDGEKYSPIGTVLIRAPFSIYFGWITVATIANITVFLVSIKWNGFGLGEYFWVVAILIIGAIIGIARIIKDKNIFYGLTLVWAYSGILFKHQSESGFGGAYPIVIIFTSICIISFLLTILYPSFKRLKM